MADHLLSARGQTLEQVFAEIVRALSELTEPVADATPDRMPLLVRAATPPQLLCRFIAELLELIHETRFVAVALERFTLEENELRAAVSGWSGSVLTSSWTVLDSELHYDVAEGCWRARARVG